MNAISILGYAAALAQTATAGTADSPPLTLPEILAVALPVITTIIAAWQGKRAWTFQTMFRAAAVGFKAALDSLPPAKAEAIKADVKTDVLDTGGPKLNEAMKAEVKKALDAKAEAPSANRVDGLPKLALLPIFFALSLFASSCVNAGVHDAAVALRQSAATLDKSADVLHRSSVPNPAYSSEERASWEMLWSKHQASIRAVQDAIQKLEETSR